MTEKLLLKPNVNTGWKVFSGIFLFFFLYLMYVFASAIGVPANGADLILLVFSQGFVLWLVFMMCFSLTVFPRISLLSNHEVRIIYLPNIFIPFFRCVSFSVVSAKIYYGDVNKMIDILVENNDEKSLKKIRSWFSSRHSTISMEDLKNKKVSLERGSCFYFTKNDEAGKNVLVSASAFKPNARKKMLKKLEEDMNFHIEVLRGGRKNKPPFPHRR